MAHKLKAVAALRPKLKRNKAVDIDTLAGFIEGRTGINRGNVYNLLFELQEAIVYHNKKGLSVRFPGLGMFVPQIALEGNIKARFRQNSELSKKMGTNREYEGEIFNSDNIGKTFDELIALWNEENPTDPVDPDPVPTPAPPAPSPSPSRSRQQDKKDGGENESTK